jgi:ABC-type sugar transport system ATPase subunit
VIATAEPPLLEVRDLSMSFPGVRALDGVSLDVTAGQILGLVGHNGSGKSTLVKVLAGLHTPDPGSQIKLGNGDGGSAVELHFIHQDLGLVETLSTVENLDLGRRYGHRSVLPSQRRQERQRAEALIAGFGAGFDVERPVGELSAAERTIVAIARALDGWEHPRNVLVLDEPTASLHGDEVQKLFVAIHEVAQRGAGVVFVSHRLDEVVAACDRVVVLRDGRLIADAVRGQFDHDELVRLIAGAVTSSHVERDAPERGDVVLRVRGLRGTTIRSLDLDVRAGEVVGVSGVLGSGRDELASILFGHGAGEVTELRVAGRQMTDLSPGAAIAAGMAYVPADRHRHGGVMTFSVRENVTLPRLRPLRGMLGRIDRRAERADVQRWIERVDVRPPDPERPFRLLSGGNQQKVVLAKWLRNSPTVLLLDEPTQGVDVGAKVAIFDLIERAAVAGAAVLVMSSDEKELALMCDRVLVLRDGELAAEVDGAELNEAHLIAAVLARRATHESQSETEERGA